jgi:hypothetical protein
VHPPTLTSVLVYVWSLSIGQVTVYLVDDAESVMKKSAEAAGISQSKWVASAIRAKASRECPNPL